jgi:CubicO group peptidase (beta-lactamase class C family)
MKKILVMGITILFIGLTFISVAGQKIEKKTTSQYDDFDQKILHYMKLGHMPSLSACIIKNNSVVWSKGYGEYDLKKHKKASDDTIYYVASISKSITAVAIMQLYEKGYFDLDDDVSKWLPFDLKNPKYPDVNITFRMLLAHESSIASRGVEYYFYFYLMDYPHTWLKEFLEPGGSIYSRHVWNNYAPGEGCCYSNINFDILGCIVEKISNQPFGQYCEDHIFKPLNMSSTSFYLPDIDKDRLAVPYMRLVGRYIRIPIFDWDFACGGAKTTVLDLSHYLISHMNGGVYNGVRILSESSINEIHRIQYPETPDEGAYHGLGWYSQKGSDGEMYGGHAGTNIGYKSTMRMRYSDNVGVIFFYNRFQSPQIREDFRFIGKIEKDARLQIEKELFLKADELD